MNSLSDKVEPSKTGEKTTEVKGSGIVSVYVNNFDEASARYFFDEFKRAQDNEQKIVPVYIDSYGGYVDSLTAMLDVLIGFPGEVATITIGKAMSCGAILLACGSNGMRYASPNSRIMVHHISNFSWGKAPEQEARVAEMVRLQNQIFRLMAKRCSQPSDYFLKLMKSKGNVDLYMTPEEAKKHKIINYIKYPTIKTELFTKVTLK